MRHSGVSLAVLIMLLALWPVIGASPARAHASLIGSEPAEGAVVASPPLRLVLTFNEPVSPLVLRLATPSGRSDELELETARDASLIVALPAGLETGTHLLSWRVASLDGHPVGGTLSFSIGTPGTKPQQTQLVVGNRAVLLALWSVKIVFYVGLFIGVGGSAFLAWFTRGMKLSVASLISAVSVAGLFAAVILIGLQGADALSLPPRGMTSLRTWAVGIGTSFGATAIVALCALIAAIVTPSLRFASHARRLSLFGMLASGVALALSGHASSAAPQWLMRPAVFVHVVALTFWIGALLPLGEIFLKTHGGQLVLLRFSRVVPWAIAALAGSGAVLAAVQVERPDALFSTSYGLVLSAKLCLVASLLLVATWNRVFLTPAILRGDRGPRLTLARSTAIEVALTFAILALVATWRFTPPPRALIAENARPLLVHMHTSAAVADVTFEPGHAGIVQARIALRVSDLTNLDPKNVLLALENKSAGIEAIIRPATKGADGLWQVQQIPIPLGGRWNVEVEILIGDFEKIVLEEQVDFRGR